MKLLKKYRRKAAQRRRGQLERSVVLVGAGLVVLAAVLYGWWLLTDGRGVAAQSPAAVIDGEQCR